MEQGVGAFSPELRDACLPLELQSILVIVMELGWHSVIVSEETTSSIQNNKLRFRKRGFSSVVDSAVAAAPN